MKSRLYKIFNVIFVICFAYIFINIFFRRVNVFYHVNPFLSIMAMIPLFFLWRFIYKKLEICNRLSLKEEICLLLSAMFILLIIQLIMGYLLRTNPGWDLGVIMHQAESYVLTGDRLTMGSYPEYFQEFPNNIMLFWLFTKLFRVSHILGFNHFNIVGIVFNVFVINLSIILLYLCIRKFFNKQKAFMGLVLCLFASPLLLYTPIYYTDTLTLIFPVGLLLLYAYLPKDNNRWGFSKFIFYALMAIICFIGFEMKATVIIMFIAILIDFFFENEFKFTLAFVGTFLVTFCLCLFLFQKLVVQSEKYHFKYNENGGFPITQWIMMGTEDPSTDNSTRNAYGGYNVKDYEFIRKIKEDKRMGVNLRETKRRIFKYGPLGYANYLTKKVVNAWGDGTYFAPIKLGIDPVQDKNSPLHKLFLPSGTYFPLYLYFAQGMQLCILLFLIVGAYYHSKKRESFSLPWICLFGVMLFFLIWENRSRYLVNYIPVMIFAVVMTFDYVEALILKFKLKKRRDEI